MDTAVYCLSFPNGKWLPGIWFREVEAPAETPTKDPHLGGSLDLGVGADIGVTVGVGIVWLLRPPRPVLWAAALAGLAPSEEIRFDLRDIDQRMALARGGPLGPTG